MTEAAWPPAQRHLGGHAIASVQQGEADILADQRCRAVTAALFQDGDRVGEARGDRQFTLVGGGSGDLWAARPEPWARRLVPRTRAAVPFE